MAGLLLGPLLRHVGERDATIWVETDERCTVTVRTGDATPIAAMDGGAVSATAATGTAHTFTVAGHHYAVVVVDWLQERSWTPYEVLLDDEVVWPPKDSPYPPSRIRTIDASTPIRILFGSCREPPAVRPLDRTLAPDVFVGYANRMTTL